MRRLFFYSFALCGLCAAIISLTVIIGRAQPLPERIQRLHLTDCAAPCWMGIMPGRTLASQTYRRLVEIFGAFQYTLEPDQAVDDTTSGGLDLRLKTDDRPPRLQTTVGIGYSQGVINYVSVLTDRRDNWMPSLGEVVSILGSPSCIYPVSFPINDTYEKLILTYSDPKGAAEIMIIVQPYDQDLNWTTPVTFLSMFRPGYVKDTCQASAQNTNQLLRWHGLADARHYAVRP